MNSITGHSDNQNIITTKQALKSKSSDHRAKSNNASVTGIEGISDANTYSQSLKRKVGQSAKVYPAGTPSTL